MRLRRVALSLAFVVVAAPLAVAPDALRAAAPAVIDRGVADELATGGTIWIVMRERADLAGAPSIADWTARGRYVVDRLTETAARTQAGLLRSLRARGAAVESFWILNAIAVHRPDAAVVAIAAADPAVARVAADPTFTLIEPVAAAKGPDADPAAIAAADAAGAGVAPAATSPGIQSVEWGLTSIGAPAVWATYGVRGEGITVATIDTGVLYTHAALVRQYRGNNGNGTFDHDYDWYDPYGTCVSAPCDGNGHGTHTMGTIAGDDGAGNQVGVAPGARWIAARGCSTSSCGGTQLANAAQWILAPRPVGSAGGGDAARRPQLVSNSWGSDAGGDLWYQSYVDAWVASGIFPIFSNGNAGSACGTVGSPGSYASSYGVGAYASNNTIAYFSSRGPSPVGGVGVKPDISAPGVDVRSSWNDGLYNTISGTSMAAPHVAGSVALLLSAAPSLVGDIAAVRDLLDSTATPMSDLTCGGTSSDNNVWGRGRLNVYAAVTAAPRQGVGRLAGVVRNASTSAAIANATVTVSPGGRTMLTGADGRFLFPLVPGTYSLAGSAFGYDAGSVTGLVVSLDTTTTTTLTLTAQPTGTIAGVVRSSAGTAIAGATVASGSPYIPSTTTNASGAYSFAGVPVGTYGLTVAGDPCLDASSASVSVIANTSTARDLTLGARLSGEGYRCTATTGLPYRSGTSLTGLTGDDTFASVTLPFAFPYGGRTYTTGTLSTNGWFSFDAVGSSNWVNQPIPNNTAPNNALFAFWEDLVIETGGGIYTATSGSAPNRTWTVEWRAARIYGLTARVSASITLAESGTITYGYANLDPSVDGLGGSATVGIENSTGTSGLQYLYATPLLANGLSIVYSLGGQDPAGPSATLVPAATRTAASSPSYTLTFDRSVTGLTSSDFSLSTTAASCSIGTPSGSGAVYTVALLGCGEGTATLALGAGSVTDGSGNAGPASAVIASQITIDRTAPTATITAPTSPTNSATLAYAVRFSEPVASLTAGDFVVTGSGCTLFLATPDASSATATLSGCTDGSVGLSLKANSVVDLTALPGPSAVVVATGVVVDRTAPAAPSPAFTAASTTTLTLTWSIVADATPVAYRVYAGTTLLTSGTSGTTWAVAKPGTRTGYTVVALDALGNASPASVAIYWPDADKVAPGTVTVTPLSIASRTVSMSWTAATDNLGGIASYRIRNQSGKLIATVSGTTLSWSGSKGSNTSFVVSAVDIAGNEGAGSNAVTW